MLAAFDDSSSIDEPAVRPYGYVAALRVCHRGDVSCAILFDLIERFNDESGGAVGPPGKKTPEFCLAP